MPFSLVRAESFVALHLCECNTTPQTFWDFGIFCVKTFWDFGVYHYFCIQNQRYINMRKVNLFLRVTMCAVIALMAVSVSGETKIKSVAPTSLGIEPQQLTLLYDSLLTSDLTELHHLIVMVDGKIAGELHPAPFRAEDRHTLYSVSKTFTAVAVGLAVDDGLLSVDDPLTKFFPEYEEYIAGVTIDDVLTMRSGFKTNGGMRNSQTDWVSYYLSRPLVATPGERYSYDSIETYLLSAVVQKVTGKNILDLLNERVFGPMGVTDVEWERCPKGVVTGGWGIYMSSHSQVLFGQLLLNKGKWNGKQLVSEEWIDQMMTVHVVRDANDYGYQIWLCEYPGAWRADGAFGQYIIIVPQKNMVVVLNQCSRSKGWPERGYIWNTVVKNCLNCPVEAVPAQLEALARYEADASLPLLQGKKDSSAEGKYNGKTFMLPDNKLGWNSIKFNFTDSCANIEVADAKGKVSTIEMGYNEWRTSQLAGYPHYSISAKGRFSGITGPFYTGSCYAWNEDNTLSAKIHYINWITSLKLDFTVLRDGKLHIDVSENFTSKPFTIISE